MSGILMLAEFAAFEKFFFCHFLHHFAIDSTLFVFTHDQQVSIRDFIDNLVIREVERLHE